MVELQNPRLREPLPRKVMVVHWPEGWAGQDRFPTKDEMEHAIKERMKMMRTVELGSWADLHKWT